jgi:hypothetical protein
LPAIPRRAGSRSRKKHEESVQGLRRGRLHRRKLSYQSSAENLRQRGADIVGKHEQADRAAQLFAREIVGDDRIGGGGQAGLADTHPGAGDEQLGVVPGEAREQREQAECTNPDADHQSPLETVGEHAQRDRHRDVEQPEGDALQGRNLGIVEAVGRLDRADQHRRNRPVRRGDNRPAHQQDEGEPGQPLAG